MVEKTGDELEYEKIAKMSTRELLDYVLCHPEYLSDSYYRGYDTAIYARRKQLETVTMHVVMGNDYPAAVFSDVAQAEAYCQRMRDDRKGGVDTKYSAWRRIYWRVYNFEMDKEVPR